MSASIREVATLQVMVRLPDVPLRREPTVRGFVEAPSVLRETPVHTPPVQLRTGRYLGPIVAVQRQQIEFPRLHRVPGRIMRSAEVAIRAKRNTGHGHKAVKSASVRLETATTRSRLRRPRRRCFCAPPEIIVRRGVQKLSHVVTPRAVDCAHTFVPVHAIEEGPTPCCGPLLVRVRHATEEGLFPPRPRAMIAPHADVHGLNRLGAEGQVTVIRGVAVGDVTVPSSPLVSILVGNEDLAASILFDAESVERHKFRELDLKTEPIARTATRIQSTLAPLAEHRYSRLVRRRCSVPSVIRAAAVHGVLLAILRNFEARTAN
jgi:hypothetical protein